MKLWFALVTLMLGLSLAQSPLSPQAALERLFKERPAQAAWFAQSFLAQVSTAQIDQIITQLESGLGKYQRTTPDGRSFRVELERGYVPTEISLDAQGRIDGLFFRPPVANAVSPQQTAARQAALERLFKERPAQAAWFMPEFLAQVSAAQIGQIVAQLEGNLGPYRRVAPDGLNFRVEFERGYVPAEIALATQGQIQTLFFRPPVLGSVSPEQVIAQMRGLPGQTSLLVLENGQPKHSLNPEAVLAIGSTFKLTVLDALQRQIVAGRRKWDDLVPFRAEWRSLDTAGPLRDVANGFGVSLLTYATQMISISSNTATDALISIVGRTNVEALTTPRNRPFLTTREAFVLKNPRNREWLERYRSADAAGKVALLPQLTRLPLPAPEVFASGPVAIDVEWFYSVRELCEVMSRVQNIPLISRNPGLANPADWTRVAYKGGSEPGVLNLTTWLVAKDGRQLCVSATWNNSQAVLDEGLFFGLYGGLLQGLK